MLKRRYTWIALFALSLSAFAFAESAKPSGKKESGVAAPSKAYMQKIWDAWGTLDPAQAAPYYAQGPNTFYDVAPMKYNSWSEYAEGVKNVLANYKSATLTVNDDAVVHPHGDLAWGTATIKEDAVRKDGKREMATFRWTVIWEKQGGKWLIVHDHVSEPMP
jgi:ketosteroid isomerase-like protein